MESEYSHEFNCLIDDFGTWGESEFSFFVRFLNSWGNEIIKEIYDIRANTETENWKNDQYGYRPQLVVLSSKFGERNVEDLTRLIQRFCKSYKEIAIVLNQKCAIMAINMRDYEKLQLLFKNTKEVTDLIYNLCPKLDYQQCIIIYDYLKYYANGYYYRGETDGLGYPFLSKNAPALIRHYIRFGYPNNETSIYIKIIYLFSVPSINHLFSTIYSCKGSLYALKCILAVKVNNKKYISKINKYPIVWYEKERTVILYDFVSKITWDHNAIINNCIVAGTRLGFYQYRRLEFQELRIELSQQF